MLCEHRFSAEDDQAVLSGAVDFDAINVSAAIRGGEDICKERSGDEDGEEIGDEPARFAAQGCNSQEAEVVNYKQYKQGDKHKDESTEGTRRLWLRFGLSD